MGPYLVLKLIAECGTDMVRWPTAKHFTSWFTLAPGSKIAVLFYTTLRYSMDYVDPDGLPRRSFVENPDSPFEAAVS